MDRRPIITAAGPLAYQTLHANALFRSSNGLIDAGQLGDRCEQFIEQRFIPKVVPFQMQLQLAKGKAIWNQSQLLELSQRCLGLSSGAQRTGASTIGKGPRHPRLVN
jgi:hypothetical protein